MSRAGSKDDTRKIASEMTTFSTSHLTGSASAVWGSHVRRKPMTEAPVSGRAALEAVADAMLSGGDGQEGDFGWSITKLNRARPLIRSALASLQQPQPVEGDRAKQARAILRKHLPFSITNSEIESGRTVSAKQAVAAVAEALAHPPAATPAADADVVERGLLEALIGGPIDQESVATLGRFGWLDAFMTDFKAVCQQYPAFREFFMAEDSDAAFEAEREVDALIAAVKPILTAALHSGAGDAA
jgi:hypothetical protein